MDLIDSWYDNNAVRLPLRHTLDPDGFHGHFFSLDRVLTLGHPRSARLDPAAHDRILAAALQNYLHFTYQLELTVVEPQLGLIALHDLPFPIDHATARTANLFAMDERKHAEASDDFVAKVTELTGVPAPLGRTPEPLVRLEERVCELPDDLQALGRLMVTAASETLISSTLEQIPSDPRVAPAVRAVVEHHDLDERAHRAFFAHVVATLWSLPLPSFPITARTALGCFLPLAMLDFLSVDRGAARAALVAGGVTEDDARRVVAETYPSDVDRAAARQAARWAVARFRDAGLFESFPIVKAFGEAGLIA
jgi:hypothetical protein